MSSQEKIDKIHDIVLNGGRLKVREISETVNISVERLWHILHECLGIRKVSARWVPRLLTADHKRARVVASEQCLDMFQRNSKEFLRSCVTDYLQKGKTITGEYYVSLLDRFDATLKEKRPLLMKNSVFPPQQCTSSHECHCNGQIICFTLRNTSSSTLFPRSGSFRLFSVS